MEIHSKNITKLCVAIRQKVFVFILFLKISIMQNYFFKVIIYYKENKNPETPVKIEIQKFYSREFMEDFIADIPYFYPISVFRVIPL